MRDKVVSAFAGKRFGGVGRKPWELTGEEVIAVYDGLLAADDRIQSIGNSHAAAASRGVICDTLKVNDCSNRKADAALTKLRNLGAIDYITPLEQYPGGPRARRWQVVREG